MDGIINILKPKGISSFKALAIAKSRIVKELGIRHKSLKVGHLGTLDPAAVGVLVLLVGKACKLNSQMSDGRKTYRFVMTTGIETPSLDGDTEISATTDVLPTRQQIESLLPSITGEIEIDVPKFSAVHINGRRAYELARKGIDFCPPKKTVRLFGIRLLQDTKHLELHRTQPLEAHEFYLEVECETGTYVRSLAKLIAERLGTLAIASTIIRTKVGDFEIENAKSPDQITIRDIIPI